MLSLRNRHFFFIDLALLPSATVLAFALRLDAVGIQKYRFSILLFTALAVPVKLIIFRRLGVYSRFWRYASVDELLLIGTVTGVSSLVTAGLLFGLALPLAGLSCPRSIPFIDGLLTLIAVGGPRFAARLAEQNRHREGRQRARREERRVLVMGAGDAGTMIVKEMRTNPQLGLVPVGFLDDDECKHGVRIHGLPVLGGQTCIPEMVQDHGVTQVIIAMPTAPGTVIRKILDICEMAGVPARIIPGLYDILSGQISVSQIREVDIEDLLRREPVRIDLLAVQRMLRGCRVLVTGAGGSIGSELCRQIAQCEPSILVLLGHGENSIFAIANELQRLWPKLPVRRVIADVRDLDRLRQTFEAYRPEIVFHAAAHKHVPLMEENAPEAVTNNVLGTSHVVRLSETYHVNRLVFVSTDKAVNPTSVMGSTKRVAELLVQAAAQRSGRPFVAVRFGNVLGSRGSVVPLFRGQIARGGPVTVTHPEVRRYFMTIPEAVQLVLQAAALGQGGEVFLLDMGEPVRILDLATDLVRLSGLRPHVKDGQEGEGDWDIEIVFTGLRPGDKLFEELLLDSEEYAPTQHEKVFSLRNGDDHPACLEELEWAVSDLIALAQQGDDVRVRARLKEIVPEYRPMDGSSVDAGQV